MTPYDYESMRNAYVRDDSKMIDALIERTNDLKYEVRRLRDVAWIGLGVAVIALIAAGASYVKP